MRSQVKVWFQNRRMKWRHSKEAQAQKEKGQEQPDKSLPEAPETKDPTESECDSEPRTDCESDEAAEEDSVNLDVSEHNKTSVIMSGTCAAGSPASSAEAAATATDKLASQMLL